MASPRASRLAAVFLPPLLAVLLAAGSASAVVDLRFSPADTTLLAGDPLDVAVFLDQPLAVRTVDLTVVYNPDVLDNGGGGPGSLFDGVFVWQEFDDSQPGRWNGVAVGMGPDEYAVGPGELYVWHCSADTLGFSGIEAIEVELYGVDGKLITGEIRLDRARVQVTDQQMTPVPAPLAATPLLELSPNPFNPRVRLSATRLRPGPARIEVYDLRGRLADVIWRGSVSGNELVIDWTPGNSGAEPPAGAYLFVLRDDRGIAARAKGVLLK